MEQYILEHSVNEGLSIRQLQRKFNLANGSIRYWLKKYELKTNGRKKELVWSRELIESVLPGSDSMSVMLRKLGLTARAGNFKTLQKYARLHCIDLPVYNFQRCRGFNRMFTDAEIFVENSYVSRRTVKERLIKEGRGSVCERCCQPDEWFGKKLVMILDHKNSISTDNRKENLRLICPNCNITLDTHAGKNRKNNRKITQMLPIAA